MNASHLSTREQAAFRSHVRLRELARHQQSEKGTRDLGGGSLDGFEARHGSATTGVGSRDDFRTGSARARLGKLNGSWDELRRGSAPTVLGELNGSWSELRRGSAPTVLGKSNGSWSKLGRGSAPGVVCDADGMWSDCSSVSSGDSEEEDEDEMERVAFEKRLRMENTENDPVPVDDVRVCTIKEQESESRSPLRDVNSNGSAAPRLSDWIRPKGREGSSFSAAIRRWQLHKGREVPITASAASFAGVDSSGSFVPLLIRGSSGMVTVSPSRRRRYTTEYDDLQEIDHDKVEALSMSQHRTLARCFVRLQKHWRRSTKYKNITATLERSKRKRLFDEWLSVFYAVRMHRLRTLFTLFEEWVLYVDMKTQNRKLQLVGSTFFQFNWKRLGLTKLAKNSRRRRQNRDYEQKAFNMFRLSILERSINSWKLLIEAKHLSRIAKHAGILHYYSVKAKFAIVALRLNAREKQITRSVQMISRRCLAKEYLNKWRQSLQNALELNVCLEGASLVYDVRLCRNVFRSWKSYLAFCVRERRATRKMDKVRKGFALTRLSNYYLNRQRDFNMCAVATESYYQRHTLAVFATLAELVHLRRISRNADAIREIHSLKRVLRKWKTATESSLHKKRADKWWVRRMTQQGIDSLLENLLVNKKYQGGTETALLHHKLTLLRNTFISWRLTATETVCNRKNTRAAQALNQIHVKRQMFQAWWKRVTYTTNLACAYNLVLNAKTLKDCFQVWHAESIRWYSYRVAILRNQLARSFIHWYHQAMQEKFAKQALLTGAMFRRNKLLTLYFGKWDEHFRASKSKTHVLMLASSHANWQRMRKCFLFWKLVGTPNRRALYDQNSAVLFHRRFVLMTSWRTWKRLTCISARLRAYYLQKIGGVQTQVQVTAFSANFHISRTYFLSSVLRDLAIKRKYLYHWCLYIYMKRSRTRGKQRYGQPTTGGSVSSPIVSPSPSEQGAWSGLNYLHQMMD
uniref:Sfi1 spindle body domain-containing protein n=1 Tax=Mucochytrium quahogii TaxID=96639 RepID=A0A7S2WHD9_9STRA|mmetsp:Transcript_41519/g.66725  ORF Transcript_41519/g.66725 Transcript_41519/m.66725 type:complete len:973 (-) Transcript_41519:7-2925(-)